MKNIKIVKFYENKKLHYKKSNEKKNIYNKKIAIKN